MSRTRLAGDRLRLGLTDTPTRTHLPDTPTVDGAQVGQCDSWWGPGVPTAVQPDPADALAGPTFSVYARHRIGQDLDGVTEFGWVLVTTAASATYTKRVETDPITGQTAVTATVTVPYDGSVEVTETAQAVDDQGRVWSATSVETYPDRLTLTLTRQQSEAAASVPA